MRDAMQNSRFLGYVQVRVGDEVVALPVQALPLTATGRSDGAKTPGGFFTDAHGADGVGFGILVDSEAPEEDLKQQIDSGIADAVAHLSRRVLN